MTGRWVTDVLNDDPLLTSIEVAALFRVDPKTVARWVLAGRLSAIKTPGGKLRFRRSAIEPLLNA